ncbi:hypothetical protein [Kibdelosporangium philippinense]|uniref:hypothetical protein n=1 Tax=Kibdelosporangium philippinense TaxID=211113 RepID=UPI0036163CD4
MAGKSPVRNTRFTHVGQVTADGVTPRGLVARRETPSDLEIVRARRAASRVGRPISPHLSDRLNRHYATVTDDLRDGKRFSGKTAVGPEDVRDLDAVRSTEAPQAKLLAPILGGRLGASGASPGSRHG